MWPSKQAEWQIPAEHSRTFKPHIVYLSRQAVARFKELQALAGQDIPAFTIHDLRRTASTLLHENRWPSDVVEKALNHTIGAVRGVYNRAEYEPQRREMLQFWADCIEQLLASGRVVLGRFRQVA